MWLKAAGPGTGFEAGLYDVLKRAAPAHVLEPIAIDLTRGWMLLPDGGVPLGEQVSGRALIDAMADVLPNTQSCNAGSPRMSTACSPWVLPTCAHK